MQTNRQIRRVLDPRAGDGGAAAISSGLRGSRLMAARWRLPLLGLLAPLLWLQARHHWQQRSTRDNASQIGDATTTWGLTALFRA